LLSATVLARAPRDETSRDPKLGPVAQRARQAQLDKVRRALFPGAEAELQGLSAHDSETRRMPRPSDAASEAREPRWGPLATILDALGDPPQLERLDLWPAALCAALSAQRAELVPLQGPIHHRADDGVAGPRFTDLARRVATSGEPFFAQHGDGSLACAAFPLTLGGAPVGSVVLGFANAAFTGQALGRALGPTLGALALALAHRQEATHRARADAELVGLRAELEHHIERHEAEVTALRDALDQSQSALALRHDYGSIVHRSAAMRRVLSTLDKVTPIDLPVLILGESGVGKELLAKALHFNGPRKQGRFVAENCGAIPRDLVESTLFGHVKGAFTGAIAARQGLFELAHGGTLFLDEIGELPLDVQVKLLRVLQERRVRPVGSNREIPVDFRLVAATHRDLAQMVAASAFREDLFYRIAVVSLEVPPLRARPEDIQPLADHFLKLHGVRMGRSEVRWSADAVQRLLAHPWPGNVRELENEVLRALALCEGDTIRPKHLSPAIAGRSDPRRRDASPSIEPRGLEPLDATVMRVERECLVLHLRASGGQKVAAARSLGLSRPGLDAKLARHGIDPKSLARRLKEGER
jgi:DNA-binding NtrC family response regulator